MSTGWEKIEPSPIEFMHGRLLDLFHEWRKSITDDVTVEINGSLFNDIVVKAKKEVYVKYKNLKLDEAVLKEKLQ